MHVDNKGIIDVVERRKEMQTQKAGDAESKFGEELHLLTSKEILVVVEHAKAHRTEKDKKVMSYFEKFVTEGKEKADELAREGALLEEGFMAQTRAKTV